MADGGGATRVAAAAPFGGDPRLRIIMRNAGDIASLRAASRLVPRLPRSGIRVMIDGFDPAAAARLEDRARRYIRACGCAEGAVAALLILGAAGVWRGFEIAARGWRWGDMLFASAAMILAGLGLAAAKFGAIGLARRRFERCCDEAITLLRTREGADR